MLTSPVRYERLRCLENQGDDWAGYGAAGMNEEAVEIEDPAWLVAQHERECKRFSCSVLEGTLAPISTEPIHRAA